MPIFAYQHTQKLGKNGKKSKKNKKHEKKIEKFEKQIEQIRTKDRTTDNNPTPQRRADRKKLALRWGISDK
jgi:hypothetical protein